MTFLGSSLFLGKEASYNFFGIPFEFKKSPALFDIVRDDPTELPGAIGTAMQFTTLPTLQTFIFEMSKVTVIRLFTDAVISNVEIPIGRYKEGKTYVFLSDQGVHPLTLEQEKLVLRAANVGSMFFSVYKLSVLNSLSVYFSGYSAVTNLTDLLKMGTYITCLADGLSLTFGSAGLLQNISGREIYYTSLALGGVYNIAKIGLHAFLK